MSEKVTWSCSVKKVFLKFRKIGKKTPVPVFFDKVADLKQLYEERGFGTGVFLWILRNIYELFFL